MQPEKSRATSPAVILFVVTVINLLNYFDRLIVIPMFDAIKAEFGCTDFQLGLLASIFTLVYSLVVLPFVPAEDSNIYKPTSARYGLLAVVDMIAMVTAELRGPGIVEGMRRIKMSLKSTDAQLPIGD